MFLYKVGRVLRPSGWGISGKSGKKAAGFRGTGRKGAAELRRDEGKAAGPRAEGGDGVFK